MKTKTESKLRQTRRHFINCNIAGFSYWDGAIVLNDLKPGMRLQLVREPDNKFDAYAVALYCGEYKLGFVPRTENRELSKFCEMGYSDIFDVRISRVAPDAMPENQVCIIIYILGRQDIRDKK